MIYKTLAIILFFVLCINSQVTEQWVKKYNGTANSNDAGYHVIINPSGNIAVTGYSNETGSGDDVCTLMYDQTGNLLWNAKYNGPLNRGEYGSYISCDENNNIIVAGSGITDTVFNTYGAILIKYNSQGVLQWAVSDFIPNQYRFGMVAKADNFGNIYFGEKYGIFVSGIGRLCKYSPSGSLLWQFSTGRIYDINISPDGSVYATGTLNYKFLLYKFSPAGSLIFCDTLDFGPGYLNDAKCSLITDSLNNIYITGLGLPLIVQDTYTLKISPVGDIVWQKSYTYSSFSFETPCDILIDRQGNIYVGGTTQKDIGIEDLDYFVLKYSNSGNLIWTAYYNNPASSNDFMAGIALDIDQNVVAAGSSAIDNLNTYFDFATVKFNNIGNISWIARYNGSANQDDYGNSIATDNSGNIVVTGVSTSNSSLTDFTTIKYKSVIGIKQISEEVPAFFSLSQNYPNPFNPTTNIKLSIPIQNSVKLIVYDVLGNEISVLVNSELKAGAYSVDFDGISLASGVYFYRLTSGNFSDVKKMILVK